MQITKQWLLQKEACEDGIEFYEEMCTDDLTEILINCLKYHRVDYVFWLANTLGKTTTAREAIVEFSKRMILFKKKNAYFLAAMLHLRVATLETKKQFCEYLKALDPGNVEVLNIVDRFLTNPDNDNVSTAFDLMHNARIPRSKGYSLLEQLKCLQSLNENSPSENTSPGATEESIYKRLIKTPTQTQFFKHFLAILQTTPKFQMPNPSHHQTAYEAWDADYYDTSPDMQRLSYYVVSRLQKEQHTPQTIKETVELLTFIGCLTGDARLSLQAQLIYLTENSPSENTFKN